MTRYGGAGPQPKRSVLVVDDDPQCVDFLRLGFEHEGFEIFVAATGADVLRATAVHHPDVIILERLLPGLTGLEATRLLRADGNDAAIIMLDPCESVDDRVSGLEAGADDYVTKPFAFRELMARVRAVLRRRHGPRPQSLLIFEDVTLDRESHVVKRRGRIIDLTPREFELLEMFLRHPRQVLTREVILASVWGIDYYGDDNVLEVYIHTLREKLGDRPPQLIQTVRGAGYVLRGRDRQAGAVVDPAFTRTEAR